MIVSAEHTVTARGVSMRSRTFVFGDNQQVAVALYSASSKPRKYLRIQYGCLFGTAFGSSDCDCGQQVASAIEIITKAGGVLIYFRDHEALGLGIFEKAEILAREQVSQDAHQHSLEKLHRGEARHSVITFVPEILSTIGGESFVLLSGNKEKVTALRRNGVQIDSMMPLPVNATDMTPFARDELAWKVAYSAQQDR